MSKKVVIVSSSPRAGGNSDRLADAFAAGAREAGNVVEKIALREKSVNFCRGCGRCYADQGPCWQKDDANEIGEKLMAADVIVLATPVYFYAMSAQLKVLLDRMCGKYYRAMTGKDFYFLASAAEEDPTSRELNKVFDNLEGFTDCVTDAHVKGKVLAAGVYEVGAIDGHPALAEAKALGAQIA